MKDYRILTSIYLPILVLCTVILTSAQTTAFNFQGRLNDGSSPANGKYDLEFRLYDALTGDNIVGTAILKPNLTLVNGVFSTQLDFGATAFNGSERFIEIRLRAAGSGNNFVILGPRQQILSVPYTIRSLKATLADNAVTAANSDNAMHAVNADNAQTAQTAVDAQNFGGSPPSKFVSKNISGDVNFGSANLKQIETANGLPKAILRLDRDGNIVRCYNSITNSPTGSNCGFSVNHNGLGSYIVNFGFSVQNSVFSITTDYDERETVGLIYLRTDSTSLNITVHYFRSQDFTNAPVNLVVY